MGSISGVFSHFQSDPFYFSSASSNHDEQHRQQCLKSFSSLSLSTERCWTLTTEIMKTTILTFGKVLTISWTGWVGASFRKSASNCPTNTLKYVLNRPWHFVRPGVPLTCHVKTFCRRCEVFFISYPNILYFCAVYLLSIPRVRGLYSQPWQELYSNTVHGSLLLAVTSI